MTFDYVIVGGGSAGSTLASRLSEDGSSSVCLLEAGGEGKDLLIRTPAGTTAGPRLQSATANRVWPSLIGGNTNAPTIMIAEKAADLILGRPAPAATN